MSTVKYFNPTGRSKAMIPVLFLFFVALWFILRRASCFKVLSCSLPSCFFISFSIVITSIGEEEVGLCFSCICLFVLHVLVFVLLIFLLVSGGCLPINTDYFTIIFILSPILSRRKRYQSEAEDVFVFFFSR